MTVGNIILSEKYEKTKKKVHIKKREDFRVQRRYKDNYLRGITHNLQFKLYLLII